ncbi:MAG: hypothetical protein AB1500_00105 [Bacillota bacterium]
MAEPEVMEGDGQSQLWKGKKKHESKIKAAVNRFIKRVEEALKRPNSGELITKAVFEMLKEIGIPVCWAQEASGEGEVIPPQVLPV